MSFLSRPLAVTPLQRQAAKVLRLESALALTGDLPSLPAAGMRECGDGRRRLPATHQHNTAQRFLWRL